MFYERARIRLSENLDVGGKGALVRAESSSFGELPVNIVPGHIPSGGEEPGSKPTSTAIIRYIRLPKFYSLASLNCIEGR